MWFAAVISVSEKGCGFAPSYFPLKGEGKHMTLWSRFRISAPVATEWVEWEEVNYLSLKIWVWPNGFQQKVVGEYEPGPLE